MPDVLREITGDLIEIATDSWTEPFWQAGREGRLVVAKCADCGQYRMPPTPFCPHCNSQSIIWEQQPDRGILYTYTISNRSPYPGLMEDFPWAAAVVELPEAGNSRIMGNIVDATAADLAIGMPVEILWGPAKNGWKVPLFRPLAA